jgi:hypothetical protein
LHDGRFDLALSEAAFDIEFGAPLAVDLDRDRDGIADQ